MPAVSSSRYGDRSPRRRATAIALTVAAHLLLAWLLLHLGPSWTPSTDEPTLTTFDVAPAPGAAAAPAATRAAEAERRSSSTPRPAPPLRVPTPSPIPAPPVATTPGMLALDFDLGTVPRQAGEASPDRHQADSVAAYGPGAGPGGERLYGAEWEREPRDAELNGYLPRGVPADSWAMIACRTIPDNQVENCRTLGEGPPGSGLARAMRQAAWQFRILPPRMGGKPMIGAWVRIRFDWTSAGMRAR
ncbi:hypothetical protein [Sphingomonas rubra]|uniref:Protein TonB n=1 Tax=Sphingomonas rubra TaxID=634430 RepID=A0A1I5T7K3_9SPHN|nr:hypothetical protein [Sphingomonas rubra]SFP79034.1 protein TonB [Sphingomonas rubra]